MAVSSTIETLLQTVRQRARDAGLPYFGNVLPEEGWVLMQAGAARLIDVRSAFEHEYVGRVPETTLVEWKRLPGMVANPDFLADLARVARPAEVLLFLCRSGVRSHAAAVAATEAGYTGACNLIGGFEGDLDANKQRSTVGGWRKAGLPWIQG